MQRAASSWKYALFYRHTKNTHPISLPPLPVTLQFSHPAKEEGAYRWEADLGKATSSGAFQEAVMTLPLTPLVNDTMPMAVEPMQTGIPFPFPNMADAGPNLQGTVSRSLWAFLVLATILVALRMYCKYLRYRSYAFDDGLLVASWVGVPLDCGVPRASRKVYSTNYLVCSGYLLG